MPKFPVYQQQTVLDPGRVTPEQAGASIARGMGAIGQGLSSLSDSLMKIRERDMKVQLNKDLNDMTIKFAEKEDQYGNDFPRGEGMNEQFEKDWSESYAQLSSKYAGDEEAQIRFDNLYRNLKLRMIDKQAVYKAQSQVADFREGRDVLVTKVAKGDVDPEYGLAHLNAWADSIGGVNPQAKAALVQENQDMVGYAAVNNILDTEGFIAADEAIDSKEMEVLSASTRSSLKSKIKSEAGVYVRRETKNAADLFAAGYPVGSLDEEIATAERFGFDDNALQLRTIQTLQQEVNSFVLKPSKENIQIIKELDRKMLAGDISDTDLSRVVAYKNALSNKQQMLAKDPYTWLDRSGWNGEPIPVGDPLGDMSLLIEQRRAIRAKVLEKEGVKIPLLRPEEVAQFVSAIGQSNPEDQVALINNLTMQLDGSEIGFTAQQIAPKDNTLAVAMVNSQYAPDVTRDIMLGRSREVPLDKDSAFDAAFLETVGLAIEDETARQQAMDAAKALYKEHVFRTGDNSGMLDSKAYAEAVNRAIGPLVSFGGNKTLSFRDDNGSYVPAETLESLVDDITVEDFIATHGDTPRSISGRELDLDKMFQNMQIVSVGDGLYSARNNMGQFAMTSSGEKFEIDLRALLKYQRSKPIEITGSRRRER